MQLRIFAIAGSIVEERDRRDRDEAAAASVGRASIAERG